MDHRRQQYSSSRDRKHRSRSPQHKNKSYYRDSRRRSPSPRSRHHSFSRDDGYSRRQYQSPHHDNRPLPSPPPANITVTRDYHHGASAPEDEIDLFGKGSSDIERRRLEKYVRYEEDHTPVSQLQMPFEGSYGMWNEYQTEQLDEFQTDDVSKFESSRQYSPEVDYRDSFSGDQGHYDEEDAGDQGHYDEEDAEEYDPRGEMFSEELDILEGKVKQERTYYGVGFSCDLCKISLTDVNALQMHFAGARHKKELAKRGMSQDLNELVRPPKDKAVREKIMRCTLCNVIVQGWEINVHTQSPRHQDMLMSVPHSTTSLSSETDWYVPVVTARDDFTITNGQYECLLCAVTLPEKEQYESHILGKRHQKRLRRKFQDECDPDEGMDNGAQYWCSVCKISCCSSNDLDTHFSGRLHARMLRVKGVSEEEIRQGLEENTPIYSPHHYKVKPEPQAPKKGLYGSLPALLAAQSDSHPSSTSVSSRSASYHSQTTNKSSIGSSSRPHPLSVGAFLQSLTKDEPAAEQSAKVEAPKVEEKDKSVSQFLDKISFQHTFQSAVRPPPATRDIPQQRRSVVEQLASRKSRQTPLTSQLRAGNRERSHY